MVYAIKKNLFLCILYIVTNIIVIMAVNYAVGRAISFPYEMGKNHIVLRNYERRDQTDGFDFVLNKAVVIVAETDEPLLRGIYDPQMRFFITSTKILDPTSIRYFSMKDYEAKNKVGIVTAPILKILNTTRDFSQVNAQTEILEKRFGVQSIMMMEPESFKDGREEDEVSMLANLLVLNPDDVRTVYLDSENRQDLQHVKEEFIKRGYVAEHKKNYDLVAALEYGLGVKYAYFVLLSAVFAYILFLYSAYLYFSKFEKHISISKVSGAFNTTVLGMALKYSIGASLCLSVIASGISGIYLGAIGKCSLERTDLFLLQAVFAVFFVCIAVLKCAFMVKRTGVDMW